MSGINASMTPYLYCDGVGCNGPEASVMVELEERGCGIIQDGYDGAEYHYYTIVDIVVSIPAPVTCDIPVRIRVEYVYNFNSIGGSASGADTYYMTVIIPAGQVQAVDTFNTCEERTQAPEFDEENYYDYFLEPQLTIPDCEEQAGCSLAITGYDSTSPSLLGASDGSITVYISGNTGSSYTFRLNAGSPQSSPTFSGLPAGTYQVRVDEGGCYDSIFITLAPGTFTTSPFFVQEPFKMVASENPIPLWLSTASYDPTSDYATTVLTVEDGITNNYRLVFNLTSPATYQVTFSARDFPNKSAYFFSNTLRNSQGLLIRSNTNVEIANSLGQALENDIVIGQNYYVNTTGNSVTLRAKTASSRFNLDSSNISRINGAGNSVTTGVTINLSVPGTDRWEGDILDNYSLYVEVYAPQSPVEFGQTLTPDMFNRITEVMLPYNVSNEIKFDLSNICKTLVYTEKPNYDFTGFTTLTRYMQPVYFQYGELYPVIANTNTKKKRIKSSTEYKWVLNAALDYELANDMTAYSGETDGGGYLINVPFLTNSPQFKQTSRRQAELLYFILPKDLNEGILDVRGTVQFWDGTSIPVTTFYQITTGISVNFGGATVINVSFDNLGLNQLELFYNNLIKELNIAVYSGNGARFLTETKTYSYELEERVNRVGLSWLNKLGTFDSFDFSGQAEETIERTVKEYTVPRVINVDGSSPSGFKNNATYDVSVTKKATLNSGWINEQTFDWLMELISSNEVFIYSAPYDNYVTIDGHKYTKSSNDTLFNIEIQISYTIAENSVTI